MSIVDTAQGKVEGQRVGAHTAFRGIPFAAPPVGALRFRAPQPPPAWAGVRDATAWGNAARQSGHPIPGFAASGPQDEDCLYLNVFTPAADDRRRPVMFWIHGGGFTHGAASEALYNGGPLAERGDVVVVSINYRLGALGYLDLRSVLLGAVDANAGQLDQVAALEWVRDNIAAFGGDPGNVTIFGESAGAAAVGTLLAMRAAKGLFQRAILQSGTGRAATPEGAAKVATMLLAELGLDAGSAGKILTISADAIIEAQGVVAARGRAAGLLFGPVIDEHSLPEQPHAALRNGAAADIPMLLGTNRDEVKLFAASRRRDPIDEAELTKHVQGSLTNASPARIAETIAAFRESRASRGLPDSNLDIADAIDTEARFRGNALNFALAQREHQPDTYVYLFTYASPARHGALGACHALEMPFVFGTAGAPGQDRFAGAGPAVERLSANMMDAWLSFARTSRPAHEGIGPWRAYEREARPTMVFDVRCGEEEDPFGDERRAIETAM